MENKLLLFVLAALALMGSPGPATLSSAAMGSAFGIARGARYVAGICSGTITVLILVATGVTGLILSHPTMATLISVLAAAYIVYLAYRIATAPVGNAGPKAGTSPSVLAGYLLAISNPKAYAAIGAVYSGTILVPNALLADALTKVAILATMVIAINHTWLVFGSTLSAVLRDPRKGRIANITFAVLLLLSVGATLL